MRRLSALFACVFMFLFFSAECLAQGPELSIENSIFGDVYFKTGGYELSDDAKKALAEAADWVKKRPGSIVLLAGYDDQRTPEKESVELGWKRAAQVSEYLVSQGVNPDSIKMISFGNTRVSLPGTGEEVWSKNRRVRYRIAGPVDTEKMEGKPSGVCQRCKK